MNTTPAGRRQAPAQLNAPQIAFDAFLYLVLALCPYRRTCRKIYLMRTRQFFCMSFGVGGLSTFDFTKFVVGFPVAFLRSNAH